MKEAVATTHFNIYVHCPNCNDYIDKTDELKGCLSDGLSESNCDIEVTCTNCDCSFIVKDIEY